MKKIYLLCLVIAFTSTAVLAQDYSSYEIAKMYQKDKDYVLSYKHLLIFEYTNYAILHKSVNNELLRQLEKEISDFESYLKQNETDCSIDIKKYRGFSDDQVDSAFQNRKRPKKLIDLKLE